MLKTKQVFFSDHRSATLAKV